MNFYTFFDLLALPLWTYLIWDGYTSIKKKENKTRAKIRLVIGIIGLIADLYFVIFEPVKY